MHLKRCLHLLFIKQMYIWFFYEHLELNRNSANKSARALLLGEKVGIWSSFIYFFR